MRGRGAPAGSAQYCRRGDEYLCPQSTYTGRDADGGYAEYSTVADFAYRLPDGYSDAELALLLCAGIIGYRALPRAELPPGDRLGVAPRRLGAPGHPGCARPMLDYPAEHFVNFMELLRRSCLSLCDCTRNPVLGDLS